MTSSRQQGRQGFKGLASHDHRKAHGSFLEQPQLLRYVPGHFTSFADYTVLGHRGYDNNFHCK